MTFLYKRIVFPAAIPQNHFILKRTLNFSLLHRRLGKQEKYSSDKRYRRNSSTNMIGNRRRPFQQRVSRNGITQLFKVVTLQDRKQQTINKFTINISFIIKKEKRKNLKEKVKNLACAHIGLKVLKLLWFNVYSIIAQQYK